MNKIVVGTAPSPNVAKVGSKIGSLQNTTYKSSGGNVKIESKKLQWKAESKIGSMSNVKHKPGGGNIKVRCKSLYINYLEQYDPSGDNFEKKTLSFLYCIADRESENRSESSVKGGLPPERQIQAGWRRQKDI